MYINFRRPRVTWVSWFPSDIDQTLHSPPSVTPSFSNLVYLSLLSASTHTRSTLQGFRSRIAPQTALSLSLLFPLPVSLRFLVSLAIAHCTIAPPWGHWPRYRRRSSTATPSSSRKAARQQSELFCAPVPPPFLPLGLSRGSRSRAEPNRMRTRVTVSRADFSLKRSRSRRGGNLCLRAILQANGERRVFEGGGGGG